MKQFDPPTPPPIGLYFYRLRKEGVSRDKTRQKIKCCSAYCACVNCVE